MLTRFVSTVSAWKNKGEIPPSTILGVESTVTTPESSSTEARMAPFTYALAFWFLGVTL